MFKVDDKVVCVIAVNDIQYGHTYVVHTVVNNDLGTFIAISPGSFQYCISRFKKLVPAVRRKNNV